ncbi:hypothetical protein HK102_012238 [Quaeritorhiza haematococci]|nr:hypothetical protein HK102_012238 [Quaeritorhiza haematococci]
MLDESLKDFAELRQDINLIEKRDSAQLKAELDRIAGEVARIKESLRDTVARVQGGVQLDINLEKGRAKDEASTLVKMAERADQRVDKEIEGLMVRLEQIRDDMRKTIMQLVGGTFCLFVVYKGITYNSRHE